MRNIVIANSELSSNVKNILIKKCHVYTLEDLIKIDYKDLKSVRGMGEHSIGEIRNWLHLHGHTIKNDEGSLEDKKYGITRNGGILLEKYGFTNEICLTLYKNNIFTLEDLQDVGTNVYSIKGFGKVKQKDFDKKIQELGIVLEDFMEEKEVDIYLSALKDKMNSGVSFNTDEITKLLKNISVMDLDISILTRKQLFRNHITDLYSLIQLDYTEIMKIRYIGEGKIKELENYLNQFGLSICRGKTILEDKKKEIVNNGGILLEKYGFTNEICLTLYKNNIFTLEDLQSVGTNVYSIKHFGSKRRADLKKKLQELGIDLENKETFSLLADENKKIQERCQRKEMLLEECQKLQEERALLLQREAELDKRIEEKLFELINEVKGSHHVR